jgi:DNA-directed RNA polymerase subunit beta'
MPERIVGRHLAAPVPDPKTGEILLDRNDLVDELALGMFERAGVDKVYVRSP